MNSLFQLFVLLFAALAVSASSPAPNMTSIVDKLPPCSLTCIINGVTQDGCAIDDLACGCAKLNQLTKTVSPCMAKAGCTLDEMTRRIPLLICVVLVALHPLKLMSNVWLLLSLNRSRVHCRPTLRIQRPRCKHHHRRLDFHYRRITSINEQVSRGRILPGNGLGIRRHRGIDSTVGAVSSTPTLLSFFVKTERERDSNKEIKEKKKKKKKKDVLYKGAVHLLSTMYCTI